MANKLTNKLYFKGNDLTGGFLLKVLCERTGIDINTVYYKGTAGYLFATSQGIEMISETACSLELLKEAGYRELVCGVQEEISKTTEILARLVDTYEIGNGCGTFTATESVGVYEVEPYTGGMVRVGKVIEGKRYVYLWEGTDGENPVGDIEPDVILLQGDKDLIYLFEL